MRLGISAAAVLVVLSLGLSACGDDDDNGEGGGEAPAVAVDGLDYAFDMPDHVDGGVVTMDFTNSGRELHEYALGRLDRGKSLADVNRALASGEEPPDWIEDVGGVPVLTPGSEIRITRELRPGAYVMLCFIPSPQGKPHYDLGMKKVFEVGGDSGASLPQTDGVIAAGKKEFVLPPIEAGRQTLELRNDAGEPREFNLAGLRPGATEREAMEFFAPLEQGRGFVIEGRPPLELLGAMQSIPPGTSVYLTAEFKSGWTYRIADEENRIEARFTPE